MTIVKGGELREWLGIELTLMYNKEIEWEYVYGKIRYGIKISDSEFQEVELDSKKRINGEEPDYWFIGNPNQHSIPIRLLDAEIKNWDPHKRDTWAQDKLKGRGIQDVFSASDGKKIDKTIINYHIDKEVKKPRFSEGPRACGVMVD
jgi:hypothetical protein